jgi:CubicO group peptidase (beta-lactamase class C family)
MGSASLEVVTRMRDLLPFILPGIGLYFVLEGARMLISSFFRRGRVGEQASPSSELHRTFAQRPLAWFNERRYGLFWLGIGLATMWFADGVILIFVGLFWTAIGGWNVFFVSQERRAKAAAIAAAMTNGLQRWSGAMFVVMGLAILWFSGLSVGVGPVAAAPPREVDAVLAELVTRHVERDFRQNSRVGLVVGVVSKDQEALIGFGCERLGDASSPNADTVFEIGSITKTFTGILLAQRIERGDLELDDVVGDLLPEGWAPSEAARTITLEHLTTHTSGIPRLPANLLGVANIFGQAFGGDPYRSYSEEDFRAALADVELEFEPGASREYSNFAVGLLGFLLATHNGTDYETLLKSEILKPLGMNRTTITNDPWHDEHVAPGYRGALTVGQANLAMGSSPWNMPDHLAGCGGIRSTCGDMLRYLKVNMGRLSSPLDAAIRRSHQELYEEYPGRAMGMNWIRSKQESIGQTVIWHNGGTGGYRSYLGFTEDGQFGVVVLSNTTNDVDDLGLTILEALARSFGNLKPVTKDGYAKVAPFSGVRWENDRPIVLVEDRWAPLVSIDGLPIDRVLEFSQKEFDDKARKRFAEDLVELLAKMGHEPWWEVTLGLEASDGQIEHVKVMMTEENRDRVRE